MIAAQRALLALGLVLATLLCACGPEQTTQAKEDQQIQENIDSQRQALDPLVGKYNGILTRGDGVQIYVGLSLIRTEPAMANAGRNETTTIPTLDGSFLLCAQKDCFSRAARLTNQSYKLSGTNFNAKGSVLSLYASDTTSQTTTINTYTYQIYGKFNGSAIIGNVFTSDKSVSGTIILNKVN